MGTHEHIGPEHPSQQRARAPQTTSQMPSPQPLTALEPAFVLHLQRTVGNQAVNQLLRGYQVQQAAASWRPDGLSNTDASGISADERQTHASLQRCGTTPCACAQKDDAPVIESIEEMLAQRSATSTPVQRDMATLVQRNEDDSRDRSRQSRPRNCPPGTVPIDQSGRDRDTVHGIKKGIGAGPRDWVGISPDGHVITGDGEGNAEDHGPAEDYSHRSSNQGDAASEQQARDALPSWAWVVLGAAGAAAVIACFASGVCEAAAIIAVVGEATAAIIIGLMEAAGLVFASAEGTPGTQEGPDQQQNGSQQQQGETVAQSDAPTTDENTISQTGQAQPDEQNEQLA